jgi:hypothetical protein
VLPIIVYMTVRIELTTTVDHTSVSESSCHWMNCDLWLRERLRNLCLNLGTGTMIRNSWVSGRNTSLSKSAPLKWSLYPASSTTKIAVRFGQLHVIQRIYGEVKVIVAVECLEEIWSQEDDQGGSG